MKIAVSALGFLIGLAIGPVLVQTLHLSQDLATILTIVIAIICAVVAFRFYTFVVTLSIAFFFGNLAYVIAAASGAQMLWALVLAVIVGLFAFALVRALKLVDVFFCGDDRGTRCERCNCGTIYTDQSYAVELTR